MCFPLSPDIWRTSEWETWTDHGNQCQTCSAWDLGQRVLKRGGDLNEFPCVHLAEQVTRSSDLNQDAHACPDILITYLAPYREYGIPIRDGGASVVAIRYYPWCGIELPKSLRTP